MNPLGHVFRVSTTGGQRSISFPGDLSDYHRTRVWEGILQGIASEQITASAYYAPGLAKVIHGRDVYYTIFEKIQDSSNRPLIAAHALIFSLEALIREAWQGRALLLPNSPEDYKGIVTPSMVHGQERRQDDIELAIVERVSNLDVPTVETADEWNSRELNWLIDHPQVSISNSRDGVTPEAMLNSFLRLIPPLLCAHFSFAVSYVPNKCSFNFVVPPNTRTVPRGISSADPQSYRSESEFRAAVNGSESQKIFDASEGGSFKFDMAWDISRQDPIVILKRFREGLSRGRSNMDVTVRMLDAELNSESANSQRRALIAVEKRVETLKQNQSAKEAFRGAVKRFYDGTTGNPSDERDFAERILRQLTPPSQAPVNVPKLPSPREKKAQPAGQGRASQVLRGKDGESEAAKTAAARTTGSVLDELAKPDDRSFEEVRNLLIEFIKLAMQKIEPNGFLSEESSDDIDRLWQHIHDWRAKDKKDRSEKLTELWWRGEQRDEPSAFENLIYLTIMANSGKRNKETGKAYEELINSTVDRYKPKGGLFGRKAREG